MVQQISSKQKRKCFVSEKPYHSFKENVHKKVCQNLPVDYEYDNQYYCVLHFPDDQKHKNTNFNDIFQKRLQKQENDFQYIYFSDRVHISQHKFTNKTTFLGCIFLQDANFIDSIFTDRVDFSNSIFTRDIWFAHVTFTKNAYFSNSVFEINSEFVFLNIYLKEKVYFSDVVFRGDVIFDDFNTLNDSNVRLYLDDARTENAERINFKNSRLSPNWFVNINSRKFLFHNIDWENANDTVISTKAELKILQGCKIYTKKNRLLTIACRQLADNYEENNHFEQASYFRQIANESKRLEEYAGFKVWSLHWWYWLSSFYGESWIRASIILLIIVLLIFPFIYTTRVFQVCPSDKPVAISLADNNCLQRNLNILDGSSILQSLSTATFQTVEYRKPVTGWGEFWIIVEKIFVPIQAALLLLAIRRKFMR